MARVDFRLKDRLVLIPLEVIQGLPLMAGAAAVGMGLEALELRRWEPGILLGGVPLFVASIAGSAGVPAFLPLLPSPSFALKGAFMGALAGAGLWAGSGWSPLKGFAVLLSMAGLAAWEGLAFTGSTTFTNLAGVRKDMRMGLPMAIAAGVAAIALRVVAAFLGGGN
jgi:hypothetical protein